MNKRRKAYKNCRPIRTADYLDFWADDVRFEFTPLSEKLRRVNAVKRRNGIPQSMAILFVRYRDHDEIKPFPKEKKHIYYATKNEGYMGGRTLDFGL